MAGESSRHRESPAPPRKDPKTPWRSEGVPGGGPPAPTGRKGRMLPPNRIWIFWLLLALIFGSSYLSALQSGRKAEATIPYTEFAQQVRAGNVKDVYTKGFSIEGELRSPRPDPEDSTEKYRNFRTERPSFAQDQIFTEMLAKGVVVQAKPINEPRGFFSSLVMSLLPTLLFVGLWVGVMVWISKKAGGGGMLGSLKRTPKPVAPDARRATFEDVAGIDEVENELAEIVDFLKHPDKYRRLGAKIPRGVLLTGLPGTGKTLLARALAGEADVPFYSAAASEFVEMVVGVGAARVRELFVEARKTAPSIIFIDEIDTIGRARGTSSFGGSDEREQTLNQILTEMDGFTGSEGVVVVAATNRPDVLDSALLRPGRFDRQIAVSPPDLEGRTQILGVHTRGLPLAPDVDLQGVARMTPGMTGADLANLVNEAALLAVKRARDTIGMKEFTAALDKVQLGAARGIVIPEEERRRTAYHEAGHAVLGMLFPGADPVRKITIVPHGRAMGVTLSTPENDRYAYDRDYLRGRIIGALGGMAAEDVVFGVVTTGAESDLEQVTRIARAMVGRWGMSERVGRLSVLPSDGVVPLGTSVSPGTLDAVDEETRRIVEECYTEATRTLRENRARLDALTSALLERETLDETEAYAAAGVDHESAQTPGNEPDPSLEAGLAG